MKKSRFTEEQIAFALKQAETGTPVAEVLRRMAAPRSGQQAEIEVFEQWFGDIFDELLGPAADAPGVEIGVEIRPPTDYM